MRRRLLGVLGALKLHEPPTLINATRHLEVTTADGLPRQRRPRARLPCRHRRQTTKRTTNTTYGKLSATSSGIAEARIAQVKAEMAEHGVKAVKVPSKTFLVDNYTLVVRGRTVSAAWLYSLLSGLAHHQTWAIGASNLGTPADVDGISGSQRVPAQANMPYTLMATQIAISSFRRALAVFADYLGR